MMRWSSLVLVALLLTASCVEPEGQPIETEGYSLELGEVVQCSDPVPADQALPYADITAQAGISFASATPAWNNGENNYISIDIELNGGIAATDLNSDSALDLLFIDYASPPKIFLGDGQGSFTEVSAHSLGIETNQSYLIGASAADINGDGHVDLFLLANGPNMLFMNQGNGSFTDASDQYGLAGPMSRSLGAAWADPDRDGDLDVMVVNHGAGSSSEDEFYLPQRDQLFIQEASVFEDHIELLYPDARKDGYGYTAGWFDADDDGLLDLYVVNDLAEEGEGNPPNFFAHNVSTKGNDKPHFDMPEQSHLDQAMLAMGLAVGDMDGDGDLDIHVSNAGRTFLARNDGDLRFIDDSLALAGLSEGPRGDISWSTEFFDFNNNGRLELFCSFGHMPSKASHGPNHTDNPIEQFDALWSRDQDGSFEDLAPTVGIDSPLSTRSVVAADFDGNGFLDLITWALYEGPRLYQAGCNQNTWLIVELDQPGTLNRDAIGARIEAWSGAQLVAVREIVAGSTGALSVGPAQVHLGLGQHELVELRIRWPQGEESVHPEIPTRRTLRIVRHAPT
jgi:enediyne biosynthesis protein E4